MFNAKVSFWVANALGWLLVYIINVFFQTAYLQKNFRAFIYSIIIIAVGFSICFCLRYVLIKFKVLSAGFAKAIFFSFFLSILFTCFHVLICSSFISLLYPDITFDFEGLASDFINVGPLFFIWTLIYVGYVLFMKEQKLKLEKYEISLSLKEAELANLRNQLSPHFLFNAINNVRSLILIEPEKARSALMNISDILRYALNYQKNKTVTLKEEMDIVNSYIELNKIHLGNEVYFKIQVDTSLLPIEIPPLSLQLLLENAIKHGDIKDQALVSIEVVKRNNLVYLKVTNPGRLLSSVSSKGIGVENLKQRLSAVFGDKVSFSLLEKNNFVTAVITINYD